MTILPLTFKIGIHMIGNRLANSKRATVAGTVHEAKRLTFVSSLRFPVKEDWTYCFEFPGEQPHYYKGVLTGSEKAGEQYRYYGNLLLSKREKQSFNGYLNQRLIDTNYMVHKVHKQYENAVQLKSCANVRT